MLSHDSSEQMETRPRGPGPWVPVDWLFNASTFLFILLFYFFSRTLGDPMCGLSQDPARRQIAPIVQSTGELTILFAEGAKRGSTPEN